MSLISIFLICATIFNSAFTCPFLRFSHSFRAPGASHSTLSSSDDYLPDQTIVNYISQGSSIPPIGSGNPFYTGATSASSEGPPLRGPAPVSPEEGSQRAGGNDANWENKVLQKHNEFRASHGAQALSLDPKLSQLAQEWADKLGAKSSVALEHRPNNEHGENIFWSSVQNADVEKAVQDWYKEKSEYDPNNPDANFAKTGHFTQVVWKASQKMGCGKSSVKTGTFIVCNYDPAGNVKGQYKENVTP
ncbi:Golgi-associated plant pathogenesis-related protein 1-like isoform X2 [Brevipalpus obovatus]|uniref:Golgi-associated plant pathogenesis-related protein 1-like isoform X2 n=1 Tax=Brevipalpus obovatus TaxID=246614 RepID=UPI003D9ECF04